MGIEKFFYPSTICLAGASTKEKSIGYELLKTIKDYGFTGKIYPVNPKADEILGYRCCKTISGIDDHIDLAIVAVPKRFVEDTIDELLQKKTEAIILITAGFKETGKEGAALEREIAEKIKAGGARLVGPNCMGVINAFNDVRLNATFVAEEPEPGGMAFLSQSGALGAAVINALRISGYRFGHFISAGNKADLNENDFITYWQNDTNITSVGCYLESFEQGEALIDSSIDGTIQKPLIILKAGRTESGMEAAQSHTGALGSSDKVVDALLQQFGIIRAETIDELFETAKAIDSFPLPKGKNTAVITNAGGPAILAVDRLDRAGLQLADFSESTTALLRDIVHPEGSIKNPVDLLPGGTPEQYGKVIEIAAADPGVDTIIAIFVEPVMVNPMDVVNVLKSITISKPLLPVILPLPEFWEKIKNESGMPPILKTPEIAADITANLLQLSNKPDSKDRLKTQKEKMPPGVSAGFLLPADAHNLALKYGLPIINEIIVEPNRLETEAGSFFYPAVLKGISSAFSHKSDIGGVKVNLHNKNMLLEASDQMRAAFEKRNAALDAFLIQPYLTAAYELLLGGFRDPSFGPVIMFGTGGKYVEFFNDTAIRSAKLTDNDIISMIEETNAGTILKGVRGEKGADMNALKAIIRNAAILLLNNEWIEEFDCNPLIYTQSGEFAIVDIRIKAGG